MQVSRNTLKLMLETAPIVFAWALLVAFGLSAAQVALDDFSGVPRNRPTITNLNLRR
ncbi:hypothetical protein H6F89_30385 [Cyanobacteria bacterium FACHB-63]|nr:hypothetical protein [Cyanobacteria bacterium FACHB-63]